MNDVIKIMGCGYIGQQVALSIGQETSVVAFVKTAASLAQCKQKGIVTEQLDLDNAVGVQDMDNNRILYLVPPQPKGDVDNRIKNFLFSIEKQKPRKIVLISTTGVYGDCHGEWVNESRPLKPEAPRAKRRADAEVQLIKYCESNFIPWVILRVPGIYGPEKLPIQRISSGEAVVREKDSPYSNRIHAYDLVSICAQAILCDDITGVYNCSDGHPSTMYDYFMKLADILKIKRPPSISIKQAQHELSTGMLSYMTESRRISNKKLLADFKLKLKYPDLTSGLKMID